MDTDAKIYIAGHKGLVGSAILNNLKQRGYTNFVYKTSSELDLKDTQAVANFFAIEKPEYVFLAAAKVGGIIANNTYRADFIYDNLMIQNNVIHQSFVHKVKKLIFLGSTCIYPKDTAQPMKENALLTDVLEYTNEPYAIAKIAGIKMCESYNLQYGTNFISVMPTNLYGPNDNFDLEKSHVLPALLRKTHLGKALEDNDWKTLREDLDKLPIESIDGNSTKEEILTKLNKYGIIQKGNTVSIEIWGSGKPMREFLWSEDMADACVYLMEKVDFNDIIVEQYGVNTSCDIIEYSADEVRNTHINIGTGVEISIKNLAETIKKEVGLKGNLFFNTLKPDGTMRKLTDPTKLHTLGWKHSIDLQEGIKEMYSWYLESTIQ